MADGPPSRLVAWHHELTAAHARLRAALRLARDTLDAGDTPGPEATRELLLYCHGFCAALAGHHTGEDTALFPALAARHPGLRPVIGKLRQDHEAIAALLRRLRDVLASGVPPDEVAGHLDGISAIMESHFRYEERQILGVLETLDLDVDPRTALGPL